MKTLAVPLFINKRFKFGVMSCQWSSLEHSADSGMTGGLIQVVLCVFFLFIVWKSNSEDNLF